MLINKKEFTKGVRAFEEAMKDPVVLNKVQRFIWKLIEDMEDDTMLDDRMGDI